MNLIGLNKETLTQAVEDPTILKLQNLRADTAPLERMVQLQANVSEHVRNGQRREQETHLVLRSREVMSELPNSKNEFVEHPVATDLKTKK